MVISAEHLVEQHHEPPRFFAMFHADAAAAFTTPVGETDGEEADLYRTSTAGRSETESYEHSQPLVFLDCSDEAAASSAERSAGGLSGLSGLFHCSGACAMDLRAQQVAPLASSLNSWGSFVLQTEQTQVVWHGKGASTAKREYALAIGRAAAAHRRCLVIDEAMDSADRWPDELWRALPDGPAGLPRLRLVTQRPTAPRLFLISTAGGRWQVDELFCFGRTLPSPSRRSPSRRQRCRENRAPALSLHRADLPLTPCAPPPLTVCGYGLLLVVVVAGTALRSENVLMLDAYNQVFIWNGHASRVVDRDVAPKMARLYLRVADDGRPPDYAPILVEGGREAPEFTCHFHDWYATGATAFNDPYEQRLEEAGRSAMFGRVVRHVSRHPITHGGNEPSERERAKRGDPAATHKECPCASLGVSQEWLADVTALVPVPESDHVQVQLRPPPSPPSLRADALSPWPWASPARVRSRRGHGRASARARRTHPMRLE